MRTVTLALLALFVVPVWASEPGQPLDCTDWVFLEPGLRCETFVEPLGCSPSECFDSPYFVGQSVVIETTSSFLRVHQVDIGCGGQSGQGCPLYRLELIRSDGTAEEVLAYVEEREGTNNTWDRISVRGDGWVMFDAMEGRLLVPLSSGCALISNPGGCDTAYAAAGKWMAAIPGFATTFDILQTYTPASGPISFRVPYMPEGFQYADYFDTYWGDLATVGDWSRAQPLQCGYPAMAPSVGDYLTVEDTLVTPAPSQGYYYVTAVNYQRQRRYGRQSNGGVLRGRDPAVLPGCN